IAEFPDLIRVVDAGSAFAAIDRITHQGVGTKVDREDCHFGVFRKMREQYLAQRAAGGASYQPARNTITNPAAGSLGSYGADANPIQDATTREVAALFDSLYSLMLRMLGYAFTGSDLASRQLLARMAIALMVTVVRPLGEA